VAEQILRKIKAEQQTPPILLDKDDRLKDT